MYEIVFSEEAVRELADIKKTDIKSFYRFERLLTTLQEHPYDGGGHPHKLDYVEGIWSRDLGETYRLRYIVRGTPRRVLIISAFGHYPGN